MVSWNRVKQAFFEARELPDAERGKFLAEIDDEDTAEQVRSLLRADTEDDRFLEPPGFGRVDLGGVTPTSEPSPPRSPLVMLPGSRVGAYELVESVGAGGMGEVYRARRIDGRFDRDVAIKILRPGLETDTVLARFRREHQALARLDHPNIARLLDAGSLEDDRPYFVMEYVDGEPIDAYCDRHRLSIDERLELMTRVLAAVEEAHRNLVVHRDLKPSNILVDASGAPKLLDFGIAKLLDHDATGITQYPSQGPLTLDYASPEQVSGATITTSSDSYSLGVVLFRLLVGAEPFRLRGLSRGDAEKTIREQLPPRASSALARSDSIDTVAALRRVTAGSLARTLTGDLDALLEKALRKTPEERYTSVESMRADLEAVLAGDPIRAREGQVAYRVRHALRRHRALLGTAGLVILALSVGLVIARDQAVQADRERDGALRAQAELERVNEFLTTMLQSPDPAKHGRDVTVMEVLERAEPLVDRELQDQPRIAATVLTTLGRSYHSLGDYDRAAGLFQRALTLREEHEAHEPERLAWSYNNMGLVHYTRGEYAEAVDCFRRAVALDRRAFGEDHPDTAQALNNLASAHRAGGNTEEALAASLEALAIRERLLGNDSLEVAESLNNLANLYRSFRQPDQARASLERAVEIRRERLSEDHPLVQQSEINLAVLEMSLGENDAAEVRLRRGLAGYRQRLGDAHPDLAYPLIHLGNIERSRGEWESAAVRFDEAARLRRAALPEDHWLVAYAESHVALVEYERGEVESARERLERHLPKVVERLGVDHPRCVEWAGILAEVREG